MEHNLSIHKDRVRPFPGVRETLGALRENGVITALVTSKRRETASHGLHIAGIENIFDAMVFYDDTKEHKPHPAPIIKAITDVLDRKHSSTPRKEMHILFVGDSPTDIDATTVSYTHLDVYKRQQLCLPAPYLHPPSLNLRVEKPHTVFPSTFLRSLPTLLNVFTPIQLFCINTEPM